MEQKFDIELLPEAIEFLANFFAFDGMPITQIKQITADQIILNHKNQRHLRSIN